MEQLRDVEVKERNMAIFTVKITREDAEVTWHKNGEKIHPSEKYEFVSEDKYRKLIVKKSTLLDEGEYTCVLAENECTADLIVIGEALICYK